MTYVQESRMEPSRFDAVGAVIANTRPSNSVLCFCPGKVHQRVSEFKNGFSGATAWAVKSNPHPFVVKSVSDAGIAEFDVASRQEIELVLAHAPNADLHFNNPIKSPEDIRFALSKVNVKSFAVDCFEELEKISGAFEKLGISGRANTMITVRFMDPQSGGTGNYKFDDKFGALPLEAIAIVRAAEQSGFKTGLTFHPGSQNREPDTYTALMELGCEIAQHAFDGEMSRLNRLNVGGGFPCQYPGGTEPALSAYFSAINLAQKLFDCDIACEPGRALVADSISLLVRVNLRRKGDCRLYINDGIYGSFMELPFVDFEPPVRAYHPDGQLIGNNGEDLKGFDVWGVTCDSLDKIPTQMRLPHSIKTGDYLEFGLMGAYTNATATDFNGIARSDLMIVDRLDAWSAFCT